MAKVSVIIPVYNAEKFLNQCISSIANQTMQDIEIIAINDGSTDNSLNVLDGLSQRYKGKLKIYTKENGGAGSARNIGIENAMGEFIKFVDADDYLEVNILEKMYTIAKEHNVSLVRGNYQTILGPIKMEDKCSWSNIKGSQMVDLNQNKDYILTETPGIGNKLVSRDLIGDLRFPEKTKWEDLAIMPVVVASSEKLFHIDEPVYNYRVNMNTTIKDFINKIPNILDVIKCVENIENQMKVRGLSEEYKSQIESLYILHTLFRVENAMLWVNFSRKKKEIVVSSLLGILDAKYPNWQENRIVKLYKSKNALFNFDMNRLDKYINEEYRNVDRETAKSNIRSSFK
ncbi:MAG: glycosyltransferase family 2 protein [Bacilli bacterium]|nr:glycosyltransferase family 2 protein [Bacilli bacterium]